ncbi:MAG TPA: diacylglycerol kinase family protein [Stellaceae bacterium]|nr:diacylglycerol kinase family protein [Stellaceae bacterium]
MRQPPRLLIIFNPAAGHGGRRRLRRTIVELERIGCVVAVEETRAAGDAERLTREACSGFDRVVAAGGDGTASEVANGLAGSGIPLALLPLGTGNVLANEIGLPRRPRALAAVIAAAPPRPIWPGRVGSRLFLTTVGVGFDAEVVGGLDHALKRRLGKLAFLPPIVAAWRRDPPRRFFLSCDSGEYEAASAIVMRTRCYAGRFTLAPRASLAEPSLHIILFRHPGRLAVLRYVGAMLGGVLHRLADIAMLVERSVSIAGGEPGFAQVDGEAGGRLPLLIAVADEPLLLVQPDEPGRRQL